MSVFSYVVWDATPETLPFKQEIFDDFSKYGNFYDSKVSNESKHVFITNPDYGYHSGHRPAAWIPDFDYVQDMMNQLGANEPHEPLDRETINMLFSKEGVAAVFVQDPDNPHFEYNPRYPIPEEELGTNNGIGELVVTLVGKGIEVWVVHLVITDWKNEEPFSDPRFAKELGRSIKLIHLCLDEWIPICYDFKIDTLYVIYPN